MPTPQETLKTEPLRHKNRRPALMICLALTIITLAGFWQVQDCGFINFDDDVYVYENAYVQAGLTWDSVKAAFYSEALVEKSGNWFPVTWLSLMLDYQIFGLHPRGFHLTNLFFHVVSTLFLFLILRRMTKTLWPSAFVACLFAIHPLHVESVAWIAERKDVLSAFFWILTMGAYGYYVEKPGFRRYVLVLLFFILGLMAKPMLVTLPFVLLLLDYWPLRRFQNGNPEDQIRGQGFYARGFSLIWEKAPLFALSILSSIITYIVQQKGGAVQSFEVLSPAVRIGNAFISYIAYIGKMIWPVDLAVYYPHPGAPAAWQVLGSALLLMVITAFVIWRAKKSPYLVTGWLWYLGTLVPVIGIVQVGSQAMADRYTYIPLIGLFIMAAWGIPELLKPLRHKAMFLFALSALIIAALTLMTFKQTGYWLDNITLFDHTIKVTDDNNRLAYNNRGSAHAALGNYMQAIEDYSRAIEINPEHAKSYYNRGSAYGRTGNFRQAIEDFTKTIAIDPKFSMAYFNRGAAYGMLGDLRQAIDDFSMTIEIDPDNVKAYANRGITYAMLGDAPAGCRDVQKACALGDCRALESIKGRGLCR